MAKYHYSPDKGSVMPCSAEQGGCKFGDQPHFNNLDEVKEFYAGIYAEENKERTFATHSKGDNQERRSEPQGESSSGKRQPLNDGLDGDRERLDAMRADAARLMEKRNDQSIPAAERIAMNKELRGIQAHADNLEKKIQREEKALPTRPETSTAPPAKKEEPRSEEQPAAPAPLRKEKPRDPNAPLGMRELNEEAKATSDEKVLMDAAERGSVRVLTSLSKNKNATGESLAKAAERAEDLGDRALRRKIQEHGNFPVEKLTAKEYAESLTENNYKERGLSPHATDAHFDAVNAHASNSVRSDVMKAMAMNKENKLSQEKVNEYVEGSSSPRVIAEALASGRYSLSGRADKVSSYSLSLLSRNKELSQENVAVVAYELGKRSLMDNGSKERGVINDGLVSVASNPNADDDTKTSAVKLYSPEGPSYSATQLHSDESLPREAKLELEKKVPSLKVKGDFERKGEAAGLNPTQLRSFIVESRNDSVLGRSYTQTTMKLNMERVKQLGITREELLYAVGASNHNAGSSLDLERGVYSGKTDSSD